MARTLRRFHSILVRMGSDITFHREEGGVACPCRTPEGFRDPAWHRANPPVAGIPPICNEQGFLAVVTEFAFKGTVQPVRMRGTRGSQYRNDLLGEVQADDRIGIFPTEWDGNKLDLELWSDAGEDYLLYDGHRYMVVQADKVPDVDGDPNHHWEAGLRLLKTARPV